MSIIAIVLACLLTAFWLFGSKGKARHNRTRSHKSTPNPGKLKNRYQAASINYEGCACSAVKAIGKKRYLAEQVPRVPLPKCDATTCDCKYVRHTDRRLNEDRRNIFCLQTDLHVVAGKSENRAPGRGRRGTDSPLSTAASDFEYNEIEWVS